MVWTKEQRKKYSRENSWWWKGGRIKWSKGNKDYMWLYKPEDPRNTNGYIQEHRIVMEKYLGHQLLPTEYIHHINGDSCDNRIENLQLVTASEHSRIHKKLYSPLNGWLRLFMKIVCM